MRVLVTGGSGFVGRHAVAALRGAGLDTVTIGRGPDNDVRADLLDGAAASRAVAAAGASHLLHLAWFVEPGAFWSSLRNLDWMAASLNLVRAFADAGGRRVVAAGTCAEYAWGGVRLVEGDTPCRPATLYGASKDALRRLLEAAAGPAGLSVAWGRIFFLYGPGEGPGRLVSGAVSALSRGETFATSHGRQRRDFMHVADAAAAFVALLRSEVEGPVNIGTGDAVPVRSILETVSAVLGGAGRIEFGARPLSPTEPEVIEADPRRLREEVGFTPRFGLAEGLRDTIARGRGAG